MMSLSLEETIIMDPDSCDPSVEEIEKPLEEPFVSEEVGNATSDNHIGGTDETTKFLDAFKPTDLKGDPLPIKVYRCKITFNEVTCQGVQWAFEYLSFHSCPMGLLQKTLLKVREYMAREYGLRKQQEGLEEDLKPLQLMREVVGVVDNYLQEVKEKTAERVAGGMDCVDSTAESAGLCEVSYYTMKNARRSMEDKIAVFPSLPLVFTNMLNERKMGYFGVFDGHGGIEAASYGAAQLHNFFIHGLEEHSTIFDALKSAFAKTDAAFLAKCSEEKIRSGSTVATVVATDEKLYIAWTGDCQVSLHFVDGKVKQLVEGHTANRPDEKRRIRNSGGEITEMGGVCRVNGTLIVTRSIGDPDFKEYVVSNPEVVEIERRELREEYIVMASDGLWDKMTAVEVGDFINGVIANNDGTRAAQLLANQAKSNGSQDNISIIIVYLKSLAELSQRSSPPTSFLDDNIGVRRDTAYLVGADIVDDTPQSCHAVTDQMLHLESSTAILMDDKDDGESSEDDEWSFQGHPSTIDSDKISAEFSSLQQTPHTFHNEVEAPVLMTESYSKNNGKPVHIEAERDIDSLTSPIDASVLQIDNLTSVENLLEVNDASQRDDGTQIVECVTDDLIEIVETGVDKLETIENGIEKIGISENGVEKIEIIENGESFGASSKALSNFVPNGQNGDLSSASSEGHALKMNEHDDNNLIEIANKIEEERVNKDLLKLNAKNCNMKIEAAKSPKSAKQIKLLEGNKKSPVSPVSPIKKVLPGTQTKPLVAPASKRPLVGSAKETTSNKGLRPQPAVKSVPTIQPTLQKFPKPLSKVREEVGTQAKTTVTNKKPAQNQPTNSTNISSGAAKLGTGRVGKVTTNLVSTNKPPVNSVQSKIAPPAAQKNPALIQKKNTPTNPSAGRPTTISSNISRPSKPLLPTTRTVTTQLKEKSTVPIRATPAVGVIGKSTVSVPKPPTRPTTSSAAKVPSRPTGLATAPSNTKAAKTNNVAPTNTTRKVNAAPSTTGARPIATAIKKSTTVGAKSTAVTSRTQAKTLPSKTPNCAPALPKDSEQKSTTSASLPSEPVHPTQFENNPTAEVVHPDNEVKGPMNHMDQITVESNPELPTVDHQGARPDQESEESMQHSTTESAELITFN